MTVTLVLINGSICCDIPPLCMAQRLAIKGYEVPNFARLARLKYALVHQQAISGGAVTMVCICPDHSPWKSFTCMPLFLVRALSAAHMKTKVYLIVHETYFQLSCMHLVSSSLCIILKTLKVDYRLNLTPPPPLPPLR